MAAPVPFLDLARSRRTARDHAPATIPAAEIAYVLEAARWAPSAANRQPWEFIVIGDPELKRALRLAFLDEAAAHGSRYRSVTEKQADLLLAPELILVLGDAGTKSRYINAAEIGEDAQEELFLLSMGAAIQNMLLAATARGLTSTWIARPARLEPVLRVLKVPATRRGVAFVALGVAASPPSWSEQMRRPVKRHENRFGEA